MSSVGSSQRGRGHSADSSAENGVDTAQTMESLPIVSWILCRVAILAFPSSYMGKRAAVSI